MLIRMLILFSAAFSLFIGCEDDPTAPDTSTTVPRPSGAFIINEGNFGHSNGSLSFYSFEENTITNNIFKNINGRDLGDVVFSMTIIDSLGYIVVNNSDKIEVISTKTWKSKGVINLPAGSSPRYLTSGKDGSALVTNLYANSVSIIDLSNLHLTGSIPVGLNPEGIAISGNKAYVANSGFGSDNTVSVIDIDSQSVIKSIKVGDYPTVIETDIQGNLQVMCSGDNGDWSDPNDDTNGSIYVIDPVSDIVIDSLIIQGHPSRLSVEGGETAFYLDGFFGNVMFYPAENRISDPQIFVPGLYYGIRYEPRAQQLFVLDALDFVQNGLLKIYDKNGSRLNEFEVGIGPGSLTFIY
ncbi:MAG: YncE family protein [Calditrichaceae bacterium]